MAPMRRPAEEDLMKNAIAARCLVTEMSQQIPPLRRYALFLTGAGDRADDLVQDCLERTLRKADLYTPDTNLRAWMMTMMRNIFINLKRRERLAARYVEATARHARRQHPPGQLDRVFVTEVFALLDELSESERDAVLMVAVDERTHAEAAAAAGVKVGTLKSRVSRGRGKLRAMAETSSEVSYVA